MQRTYTALVMDDDGTDQNVSVVLDEDILLQYCVAYDANDYETRSIIECVAIASEDIQSAIQALHRRFDLQEDFTPQLQQYRHRLVAEQ